MAYLDLLKGPEALEARDQLRLMFSVIPAPGGGEWSPELLEAAGGGAITSRRVRQILRAKRESLATSDERQAIAEAMGLPRDMIERPVWWWQLIKEKHELGEDIAGEIYDETYEANAAFELLEVWRPSQAERRDLWWSSEDGQELNFVHGIEASYGWHCEGVFSAEQAKKLLHVSDGDLRELLSREALEGRLHATEPSLQAAISVRSVLLALRVHRWDFGNQS